MPVHAVLLWKAVVMVVKANAPTQMYVCLLGSKGEPSLLPKQQQPACSKRTAEQHTTAAAPLLAAHILLAAASSTDTGLDVGASNQSWPHNVDWQRVQRSSKDKEGGLAEGEREG